MEKEIDNIFEELIENLPEEILDRLEGDWEKTLVRELERNTIPEEYHEDIKDEVFLNLAEIHTAEETCVAIKNILPFNHKKLSELCEDLKYKILFNPEKESPKNSLPSESQVGVDIIKEERKTPEPEVAPMQSSATESSAGVDIIQEKEEEEDTRPSPAKDSLLQGIEHPEEARDIESAAKKGEVYNPIKSKLSSSTGKMAPQYKGDDPYREPIE